MVLPPSQLRLHFSMKVQGAAAERDKNKKFYHEADFRRGFLPLGAFHGLCAGVIGSSSATPDHHTLYGTVPVCSSMASR